MSRLIKILLLVFTTTFFATYALADRDSGFGIEDDVQDLMSEIRQDEVQNEPDDEYSIEGERGAYSEGEDERSPDSLGTTSHRKIRKEFLDAGEGQTLSSQKSLTRNQ